VPGKAPLYAADEAVGIGKEDGGTVGLSIEAGGARMLYVPACAVVTPAIKERAAGADLLLFDGTTFTDDEMPRLGLSQKTAARMGHVAMDGPGGSLAAFADVPVARKAFVHINNTNPVWVKGSPERLKAEAAGWTIGADGMEFHL
jgi:pyrroloquinoline quinone biosynthesis protein B